MQDKPGSQAAPGLRLRRHADFQRVYKASRKQFSRQMSFFFAVRPAEELATGPRVGLTVGKVLGGAVERNRIKRRLREAVRRNASLLDGLPVDVVLHPRKSALTMEWAALEGEVAQVFLAVQRTVQRTLKQSGGRTPPQQAAKP